MTERQAIESTYWDRCSIYRRSREKDPDTRQQVQTEILTAQDIPCAVSQRSTGSSQGGIAFAGQYGIASVSYTLFCAPETDIRLGDRVEAVTGAGQILSLWAGKLFLYASHAEIPLSGEEPDGV